MKKSNMIKITKECPACNTPAEFYKITRKTYRQPWSSLGPEVLMKQNHWLECGECGWQRPGNHNDNFTTYYDYSHIKKFLSEEMKIEFDWSTEDIGTSSCGNIMIEFNKDKVFIFHQGKMVRAGRALDYRGAKELLDAFYNKLGRQYVKDLISD